MNSIRHIPHSSRSIPAGFRDQFTLSDQELVRELLTMTDSYTEELFAQGNELDAIFPVSRLLVDPERFAEDEQEPMSQKGMGVIYTMTHCQTRLRRSLSIDERRHLLDRFYYPHHDALESLVSSQLEAMEAALIIDCHSFPSHRLPYEQENPHERPEICIGCDEFHTPEVIRDTLVSGFAGLGYTVSLNQPFSGSITPQRYYGHDKRVHSVMIELRRDLYMSEKTGEKGPKFAEVRTHVQSLIRQIEEVTSFSADVQ
jgi:N-formylglutamate deformylase